MFISKNRPSSFTSLADLVLSGQVFYATTGYNTSSANGQKGLSIFNPVASGKVFYVFRVLANFPLTTAHPNLILALETSDALFSRSMTANNALLGSTNVSSANLTQTSVSAAVSLPSGGNNLIVSDVLSSTNIELLRIEDSIVVSPGNGLAVFMNANTSDIYSCSLLWGEV